MDEPRQRLNHYAIADSAGFIVTGTWTSLGDARDALALRRRGGERIAKVNLRFDRYIEAAQPTPPLTRRELVARFNEGRG
jgi:hypothetical protein